MDTALKRMLDFPNPTYGGQSNGLAKTMVDESVREDGKDNTTALCFEVINAD